MLNAEFRELKERIANGIIPATANPRTPGPEYDLVESDLKTHVEKIRAVHDDDMERAREIRQQLLPLTNHVFGAPEGRYRARTKAALQMQGVFEYDTLLPPQEQIDPEEREELREILDELDRL